MKLAQINFTKGLYIPGLGQVMKLENVDAENVQGGLSVMTSAAKVMIPWDRIDVVVTEWITLKLQGLNEFAKSAGKPSAAQTAAEVQSARVWLAGGVAALQQNPPLTMAELAANDKQQQDQASTQPIAQPGPPSKKGGRRG